MLMNRRIHLKLMLLAVSVTLTLGVGELMCRVLLPDPPPRTRGPIGNQYVYYQYDPLLGWSNTPGMRGVYKRTEFEYPIAINAHGMRDPQRSLEPAEDVFRIACLGDSFTWGIGAADGERYTDLLDKHPDLECLNFGVSGFGPVHYYLLLDRVLEFEPDLVVIAFCCENDLRDSVASRAGKYFKPYFALTGEDEIELRGFPIPDSRKFGWEPPPPEGLRARSVLFRKMTSALWRIKMTFGHPPEGLTQFNMLYDYDDKSPADRAVADQATRINKLIFGKIKERLDESGVPLLLVTAPSKKEYRLGKGYDNIVGQHLEDVARTWDFDFLNTIPLLNRTDFWLIDGHWNPQGHRKTAAAIQDYLVAEDVVAEHTKLEYWTETGDVQDVVAGMNE